MSCMFHVYQDPARTIWFTSFAGDGKFRFRPAFYDKNGKVIPLANALFATGIFDEELEDTDEIINEQE